MPDAIPTTPAVTPDANPTSNVAMPTVQVASKPTVSAAKALGLPESPGKMLDAQAAESRKTLKLDKVITPMERKPAPEVKLTKKGKTATPATTKVETKVEDKAKDGDTTTTENPASREPEAAVKPVEEVKPPVKKEEDPEMTEMRKSLAEMKEALKKQQETQVKPPAPVETPVKKEKDPETIRREQEEEKARTEKYISDVATSLPLAKISEADHDIILEGGKAGAAKLEEIRRRDAATVMFHARDSIYKDLAPIVTEVENRIAETKAQLEPLMSEHQALQRMRVEMSFKSAYPHLEKHMPLVKQVSAAMLKTYPKEVAAMSEPEFFKELERQTKQYATSIGLNLEPVPPAPVVPAVTPPVTPAAAPVAATPKPAVIPKPPASNAPAATAMTAKSKNDFSKAVVASLY